MQPEARDPAYLWDILDMARTLVQLTAGGSRAEYLRNRGLQLAVERGLEVIGEAARRISPEFKQAHPEIPWRAWIGRRNVIAHQYDDIRHDLIWLALQRDLPPLVAAVEPLLPPSAQDNA